MAIPTPSPSVVDQPSPPAPASAAAAASQPLAGDPAPEAAAAAEGAGGDQTAPAAAAATGASLYVGDLEASVGEDQLVALFSQVAPVASAYVCRDIAGGSKSLGYGYVNFMSREDATRAMENLNFTVVNGKPIRVMFSNRDPTLRKSGLANVFIKNLEPNIDNKSLYEMFSSFGTILSGKVATDFNGKSKGYGFIQFESESSAKDAINGLNGMLANGQKIFVGLFIRRQEREHTGDANNFTNVYVKNLPKHFSDNDLLNEFSSFGAITSAIVMRDANGLSRCFGFVNFEKSECARNAVKNLNGKSIGDMVLYVARAQKKSERQAELKAKFEHDKNQKFEKLQTVNLYLKNLDDDINDEHLRKLFECFGEVASCKVMLDSHGRSKGCGFVSFATVEDANNAILKMNGKMVGKKPLYVAVAQRKEERKAFLAAHFARVRALATMAPTLGPNIAPHQFNFGHGVPALFPPPPPAGFGFQPNFVPNMMMPYNMQRQPGQRSGPPHGGMPRHLHNPHQGFRHMPNRRNGVANPAMLHQHHRFSSPMQPMQQAVKHVVPVGELQAPSNNLQTSLASANPEQQREILGDMLFPLVEQLVNEKAYKVTGMLLELDKTEVLNLVESPDTLRDKVAEAMKVLELEATATAAAAAAASGSGDGDAAAPSSSSAA
uniref:Polyadenylate-binding protein n=1 Tax=Oryza rufipogon TaxID=4529 RepID=A0A0E0PZN3_ORYRU